MKRPERKAQGAAAPAAAAPPLAPPLTPPPRLLSLDAFRGFAIAAMVLVNNPGDWAHVYPPLAHAAWNGCTATDLVFPFFLFIVGVSMDLSMKNARALGTPRAQLLQRLARRALVIFLVGFALNLLPYFNWGTVRIPGVLQRIALCILLAAPLVLWLGRRGLVACIVVLFALYSALMLGVPVPGPDGVVAAGVLEPGRDFGAWLDRTLLGRHLWSQSRTWDPEGLTSTLPAVATLLFGVLTRRGLAARTPPLLKTLTLVLAGLGLVVLGSLLDGLLMPINKSLWTPSYSVFSAGCAMLVFALFYWLLDAAPQPGVRALAARVSRPLVIYGMNALFIFALSGLVAKMLGFIKLTQADGSAISLRAWLFAPLKALPLPAVQSSLLWALLFNAAMFAVAWWLWRRRWFIKA